MSMETMSLSKRLPLPFGRLLDLIVYSIFVIAFLESAWHYCLEILIHC